MCAVDVPTYSADTTLQTVGVADATTSAGLPASDSLRVGCDELFTSRSTVLPAVVIAPFQVAITYVLSLRKEIPRVEVAATP